MIKEHVKGYLFILPALVVIAVIFFYPLFQNIHYSFLDLSVAGRPFAGFTNYRIMLRDPVFWVSIKNNALLILLVPLLVVIALVFSYLLYGEVKGWKFYRATILVPYIISITAIGLFFSLFFQGRGMLNSLLRAIHLDFLVTDWLGSGVTAMLSIMFVILWREFGFGTMLFLARLSTVSDELFDAAEIDGAGWFKKMQFIVIPELATVIEFYVFIMIVTMLSWVFNYVLVMTLGGPSRSTYVTEYYIYMEAFRMKKMGVASAVSIVLFLLTGILSFTSFRFRKKLFSEYE
ncbi:MAG: sugar ABC transporter permease [Spirochaetales bacterium]|nr:MAG: sugar ABC transporter permease [Spirochaetales bacterium]